MKDVIYCSHCGAENNTGSQFCSACGKPLSEIKTNEEKKFPKGLVVGIGLVILFILLIPKIFPNNNNNSGYSTNTSSNSKSSKPPYMGTFIKDGSIYIELTRIHKAGPPSGSDLRGSPVIHNNMPTIIHWQSGVNMQYLGLAQVEPYYSYDYKINPVGDGMYEITPREPLNNGYQCIVQGDPLGFPSSWCFNVQ